MKIRTYIYLLHGFLWIIRNKWRFFFNFFISTKKKKLKSIIMTYPLVFRIMEYLFGRLDEFFNFFLCDLIPHGFNSFI